MRRDYYLGAARPYGPRCFQVLDIGCRQNIAQPKAIHAGALMPRAYLNERATRRSGCILPSGEGLGWGNVSFSSFLCAREKDRYFGSFYKRASFWWNRKKMNKRGCGGHAPAEWQNLQKQWQNLQNLHLQAKNSCRFRRFCLFL